jgi:ribosome biogenesis protein MAK21
VPAEPIWHNLIPSLAAPATPLIGVPLSKLQSLRSKATKLLDDLPSLSRKTSSSDAAFINQILQSGTHQDKLSALILLVRESPIHAVKELGKLRGMTGYKEDGSMTGGGGNKDQRVAVCKALVDWWVSGGGKESGKLRYVSPLFFEEPRTWACLWSGI